MRAAALTWIALALAGCEATPGGPAPTPPVAARPAPAPRVAADPEAQRLGLDLGIALITVQCEDASVRRQATRTRDALLERTRLLTQVDRAHGDAVWAEAEAVMAAQRSRPQRTECEAALPTLRNAEQMARSQAR